MNQNHNDVALTGRRWKLIKQELLSWTFWLTALGVLWSVAAIWIAQTYGGMQNYGPLLYPAGTTTTTPYGWPLPFVDVHFYSDRFTLVSKTTRDFNLQSLAINLASWIVLVCCPALCIWSLVSKRLRYSLAHFFGYITAIAGVICWWQSVYETETTLSHPMFPDNGVMGELLRQTSDDPLVRLTTFSIFCQSGIIFGMLCVIVCSIHLVLGILNRVIGKRTNQVH